MREVIDMYVRFKNMADRYENLVEVTEEEFLRLCVNEDKSFSEKGSTQEITRLQNVDLAWEVVQRESAGIVADLTLIYA